MVKLTFNFKEYTPLDVHIDKEDVANLNAILGYMCMGAKAISTSDTEYFMDMSFEDKPLTLRERLKYWWIVFKLKWIHK